LLKQQDRFRPLFEQGGPLSRFMPLFEATDTFLFTPGTVTREGAHVRDAVDLKRVMMTVVLATLPCVLFGIWNTGHQYNVVNAMPAQGFLPDVLRGALIVVPMILVSYVVGGLWEVLFACVRRHEINEGFLVTGLFFPLILPPTIPLWQVAVGISFGVVIGKEVFGGTGMNILNPALTARVFLFFAYPAYSAGNVWVGIREGTAVDALTGATPLAVLATYPEGAEGPVQALTQAGYSFWQMFVGVIPGSVGETSALACLAGAVLLLIAGVSSWRITAASVLGLLVAGTIGFVFAADGSAAALPPQYHLVMGGFAFGAVFMITDPVSAAATTPGKWIYGFCFGVLVVVIRLINPAYAEGVMLSILFLNVMAPLIDHVVVARHIRRRAKRA
jgi:Na+-transporting NADH:ubiquinone oxidoreductase subunit B